MTKKTTAITLSIFIAIMPFLGFPTSSKTIFYVASGLLLAVLIELISIQNRRFINKKTNNETDARYKKDTDEPINLRNDR